MGRSGDCADCAGHLVQRLIFDLLAGVAVAVFAFIMVGGSAWANEYIPRGTPIPENIRYVNPTPSGVNTRASASWTSAFGRTTHHVVPVGVSSATLGRLANAAVRRGLPVLGWGLTLKGIVDAAGLAIDELSQQVVTPGTDQQELTGTFAYCTTSFGGFRCTTAQDGGGFVTLMNNRNPGWSCSMTRFNGVYGQPSSGPIIECFKDGVRGDNLYIQYYSFPNSDFGSAINTNPPATPAVAVPDTQLGDLIKANAQVVNAVLIDPQTGAPIRTPELVQAMNALGAALAAANGETAPEELIESEDLAETVPSQTEWPGFCDWASTVCEFIDWVRRDDSEHKDLPEMELEIDPNGWSSGVGDGSCPAPIVETWTFMETQARFEFDYQPVCDFATLMRPFLITCALLCAAFIMAGLRSAGGKT